MQSIPSTIISVELANETLPETQMFLFEKKGKYTCIIVEFSRILKSANNDLWRLIEIINNCGK